MVKEKKKRYMRCTVKTKVALDRYVVGFDAEQEIKFNKDRQFGESGTKTIIITRSSTVQITKRKKKPQATREAMAGATGKTRIAIELALKNIKDFQLHAPIVARKKTKTLMCLGSQVPLDTPFHVVINTADGEKEILDVLATTELHILIMLNADGNDFDTRWNVNQVDLNRNYDHYWNTCPTTQPGSSAFSESETLANSIYMNEVVPHADLYITMHTGVWIMLYPWGKWPEQPSDWEMYHHIRDEVNSNISDIPIRNANQGLYPNCGTSRDYGYGIMGYPTFTFETDDEQFLLGSIEAVSDRLGEELDVMNYLIENVWYWRARLVVDSLAIDGSRVELSVSNLGRASTANATLVYIDEDGAEFVPSISLEKEPCAIESQFNYSLVGCGFQVNATNSTQITLDFEGVKISEDGQFFLHYQKRVVDASMWAIEEVNNSVVGKKSVESGLLPAPSLILVLVSFALAAINGRNSRIEP